MDKTVTFGDVFLYQGDEYVFFVDDAEGGVVYAGRLLDYATSQSLQKLVANKESRGIDLHKGPVFSYVVLMTKNFEKRAVICGGPATLNSIYRPYATLDQNDIEEIKKEISDGPAPGALKNLVKLLS